MKRAFECNKAISLRRASGRVMFARGFDGTLNRFRARIRKEDSARKAIFNEPLRQPLLVGDAIHIRGVPKPGRLFRQCTN